MNCVFVRGLTAVLVLLSASACGAAEGKRRLMTTVSSKANSLLGEVLAGVHSRSDYVETLLNKGTILLPSST